MQLAMKLSNNTSASKYFQLCIIDHVIMSHMCKDGKETASTL